jgi:hypothetical protein
VLLTTASFFFRKKKDVNPTEFMASVQVLKPVVRSRLVRVVAGLPERRPRPLWSLRTAKSTSILSGNEPNRTTTTRKIMYPSAQGRERTKKGLGGRSFIPSPSSRTKRIIAGKRPEPPFKFSSL